ncbi:hypothetical protein CANARDRAFT_175261 [[Candida] arabinofermentans NRRL YB-2248]|uniref:Uncharacterized protein n=1 Tax=[Candida] arabinofermentans NRRL YB-2248 TaxID=983967 RepID=A0A1E4T3P0_9ASCO|nr:hypothetical protein CANARDRAFT_175261 [[Candida] arabinofermentans NRRL YB-2248]
MNTCIVNVKLWFREASLLDGNSSSTMNPKHLDSPTREKSINGERENNVVDL